MSGLLMRRREMMGMPHGESAPSIDDYVHDHMILWVDGIENTANGHDASAVNWYDLSGNGHDIVYPNNAVINADHCEFKGKGAVLSNAFTTAERDAVIGDAGTIEIVFAQGSSTNTACILPFGNVIGTVSYKSNSLLFRAHASYSRSIAVLSGVHTYNSLLYLDGLAATDANIKANWSTIKYDNVCCYNGISSYPLYGKVYAMRIYNKVLTAAEIAQNANIDKKRFV